MARSSKWMLEIGAFLLRTETELPLKSRFVVPARLLQAGFEFLHPRWLESAMDLIGDPKTLTTSTHRVLSSAVETHA